MSKLNFNNRMAKKKYQTVVKDMKFIPLILDSFFCNTLNLTLIDILEEENGIKLFLSNYDKTFAMRVDNNSYKTYVTSPEWNYVLIFSNSLNKCTTPLGMEYHLDKKTVFQVYPSIQYPHTYQYTIEDDERFSQYEISIKTTSYFFDDYKVIQKLLSSNKKITRIKDLLEVIKDIIDINQCELRIVDTYNNDSEIITYYGVLTKYIEYLKEENQERKIYMENGKFYQDILLKEQIQDDLVPFVKKKGCLNGREKN